jgi:hypothetical protein
VRSNPTFGAVVLNVQSVLLYVVPSANGAPSFVSVGAEVQLAVEEERVVRGCGGHLELPVAEPIHLHLVQPPPRLAAAAEHRRVVAAVELVPEDVPTKRRAQVR